MTLDEALKGLRSNLQGIQGKAMDVEKGYTTPQRALADIAEVMPTLLKQVDEVDQIAGRWILS